MSLRAVPNGDEYDKDIALAIRLTQQETMVQI